MHFIIGFITAVMVLFPGSDSGGKSLYQLWMEAYEKYLYQQMYDNIENARRNEEICKNSAKNEVLHEQTASEEVQEEVPVCETLCEVSEAETETVQEVHTDTQIVDTPTVVTTPLYQVDGYVPDQNIQTYLYTRLCESGIGYFFPYAVCLIAQESTWNPMAENKNGRDKGLLQFRVEYVPWMDWRNPYQQIDYFVAQMANRAAAGCTVSDMISRHMMSDYGGYCQEYVDAVMAHAERLVQIR